MTQEEISVKIKEVKQIAVRSQLYEFAAIMRDLERKFEKGDDWQETLTQIIEDDYERIPLNILAEMMVILDTLTIKKIRDNRLGDILNGDD